MAIQVTFNAVQYTIPEPGDAWTQSLTNLLVQLGQRSFANAGTPPAITIAGGVANAGTNAAVTVNNTVTLSGSTRLLDIQNNGVEKSYVDPSGDLHTLSGPVSGADSSYRTCAAVYNTASGQTITKNTFNIINFGTLVVDTNSAVSTGASWHFTCPTGLGGLYGVCACATINVPSSGTRIAANIYVNGAESYRGNDIPLNYTNAINSGVTAAAFVKLSPGDTLDFRLYYADATNNTTLTSISATNHIEIVRVPGS